MVRRQKNKLDSENQSSYIRNPSSSIYSILNHQTTDIEKLPVNQTLLTFKDERVERKYFDNLFYESDSFKVPSKEFRANLLTFFLYFTMYLLSTITLIVLRYLENTLPISLLLLKFVFLGRTSTLVYIVLYSLPKSQFLYRNTTKIVTLLGFLIMFNLILTDDRILTGVTGKTTESSSINSLIMLSFMYLIKLLLFGSFRYMLVLSLVLFLSFASMLVLFSSQNFYLLIYELFILFTYLIFLCTHCYRLEHTSRDLFWRKESSIDKVESFSDLTEYNDPNSSRFINTEVELLIQICDKIKKNVKSAYSMIIYKDIKVKLKVASNHIDSLRKRIAGDLYRSNIQLDNHDFLDDQDKTFISQMFMQVSLKSGSSIRKTVRMSEMPERVSVVYSKEFGSEILDKTLESFGLNWNFDIWFIFQATGHSIFIASKYVCSKWGLCEEFSIDESLFDRFFQSVEKVRSN